MSDRPNILILMPDQFRADCLSCAGHPMIRTPNLDRLAAGGVRFSQATTPSPICMSARASFISGRYPHNHGMWTNRGRLPTDDETFFQLLQRSGYHTAHFGKSHYYPHGKGHMRDHEAYMHARGFDTVHETTGPHATMQMDSYMTDRWAEKGLLDAFRADYPARAKYQKDHGGAPAVWPSPLPVEEFMDSYVGARAVEFIRGYDRADPLCLFVGFPGPHEPWDAPGEYASMYDPTKTPPAIPAGESVEKLPDRLRERAEFRPASGLDAGGIQRIRANYYGKSSLIDHWIGEILTACEDRGLAGERLVVFWSDHGEMAGDHGRLYKSTYHESAVRVPLILHREGRVPAGRVSDGLAEVVDIFPTVLEAAGIDPSARALGASLLPAAADPARDHKDSQLSEIDAFGGRSFMLRTRAHKYAADDQGRGLMLYDLAADPDEQHNRIADPAAAALEGELRDRLFRRLLAAQYTMQ